MRTFDHTSTPSLHRGEPRPGLNLFLHNTPGPLQRNIQTHYHHSKHQRLRIQDPTRISRDCGLQLLRCPTLPPCSVGSPTCFVGRSLMLRFRNRTTCVPPGPSIALQHNGGLLHPAPSAPSPNNRFLPTPTPQTYQCFEVNDTSPATNLKSRGVTPLEPTTGDAEQLGTFRNLIGVMREL